MFLAAAVAVVLTATPGPMEVVKQGNAQVQKILGAEGATVEKLASKADEFVDFAELAKRAIGKEWPKLSKKQQDEFTGAMKGLLRASYAQRALGDGKSGATFEWGGEQVAGNEATVASTLVVKQDRFPVEYKLFRTDAKAPWRIFDVVTDQVSLVATYQDQFRQLIAKKGVDGLISTLKAKRDQLEKGSTTAAAPGSTTTAAAPAQPGAK